MSKITSDDPTPAQPVGAEPTSACRIGSELDSATAHQEPGTNINGAAIEKGHSPSPQPEEEKSPAHTPIVTALADIKTATALQFMTFEALKYIVPGLIVEGCAGWEAQGREIVVRSGCWPSRRLWRILSWRQKMRTGRRALPCVGRWRSKASAAHHETASNVRRQVARALPIRDEVAPRQ
jgi:hypothetical protein